MDNFTIINLQALTGTIAIILGFKYWIKPRISKLSLHEALLPFVSLNAFRYLGLMFMAKEQFYDGFPSILRLKTLRPGLRVYLADVCDLRFDYLFKPYLHICQTFQKPVDFYIFCKTKKCNFHIGH